MRRGGRIILLLALSLGLTACGAPPEATPAPGDTAVMETVPAPDVAAPPEATPAPDDTAVTETVPAPDVAAPPEATPAPDDTVVTETVPAPDVEAPPEPAAGPVEEAVFPRSFGFASGAGAWSTELEVAADGSFTGIHHDTNGGDIGEDYPNGTVYICRFSGKFSQPVKVDDLTYSLRLESIEQDETEGEETIVDGVRYIVSRPYGLDNADEILIYLPGSQRQDLPEGFVGWTAAWHPWDTEDRMTSQEGTDRLTRYGLYNVSGGQGFVSVDE